MNFIAPTRHQWSSIGRLVRLYNHSYCTEVDSFLSEGSGLIFGKRCPSGSIQSKNLYLTPRNNHTQSQKQYSNQPAIKEPSTPAGSVETLGDRNKKKLMSREGDFASNKAELSDEERRLREEFKPREIRFKTSYGHVAGLEWGRTAAPYKVLCIHGWLDNAGSFERIVPFLLNHGDNRDLYHFVALDMPGVGLSSHRPPGSEYTVFSNVIEMRRATTQLGWNKGLTLLSHSLGAHLSFLYSCIYPNQVENFISIDVSRPITFQADLWNITIANSIENYFRCEFHHQNDADSGTLVPFYSEEQAIQRLMEAHSNSLSRESAKTLMKRGAKQIAGGCTFNRDVRHRSLSVEFRPDDELMMKYLSRSFGPNLFIIRSTKSPFRSPEDVRLKYYQIFEKNCPLFHDKVIEGTHHLHMNTPDIVASEINRFLDETRFKTPEKDIDHCDGESRFQISDSNKSSRPDSPPYGKANL